jgi:hypothetical protein
VVWSQWELWGIIRNYGELLKKVLQYSLSAPRSSSLGSTIDLYGSAFKWLKCAEPSHFIALYHTFSGVFKDSACAVWRSKRGRENLLTLCHTVTADLEWSWLCVYCDSTVSLCVYCDLTVCHCIYCVYGRLCIYYRLDCVYCSQLNVSTNHYTCVYTVDKLWISCG